MKTFTLLLSLITLSYSPLVAQETIEILQSDTSYFINVETLELTPTLPDAIYMIYKDSQFTCLACKGTIQGQKKTGTWLWFYETGEKFREIPYLNGLINGEITSYYPTGEVSAKIEYVDGLKHGKITKWYNSGKIKLEAQYYDDTPTGIWQFYGEDGTILKEEHY